jgi:2Fe-2S ferredoxin
MVFQPSTKPCGFDGNPSVLEVALANNVPLNHSCGGMGSCTTCLVLVEKGLSEIGPRNELEEEHARARGFEDQERLACQISAIDGLIVRIP